MSARPSSDPPDLHLPRLRCAPFHEAQSADPIGSAGSYDGFLVVDVGLPWEREVTAQAPLRAIVDGPTSAATADDGSRWRPFARVPSSGVVSSGVVSSGEMAAGGCRVTEHRAVTEVVRLDDGSVVELRGPYVGRQWVLDPGDVVDFTRSRYRFGGAGASTGPGPSGREPGVDGASVSPTVMVCTHGRRDQCCGGPGTAMYDQLVPLVAASGGTVDVQRISHTGGHRFAPTALTFPDGYAWAHLDAALAADLVGRAEPPDRFAAHCRGSALFDGAPAQAADRAGLVEVGWQWADGGRAVQVRGFDRATLATTVRVVGRLSDGEVRAFDVTTSPDRHIPSPTCGLVDGPEYTTETVWRVDRVDEVAVAVDGPA